MLMLAPPPTEPTIMLAPPILTWSTLIIPSRDVLPTVRIDCDGLNSNNPVPPVLPATNISVWLVPTLVLLNNGTLNFEF